MPIMKLFSAWHSQCHLTRGCRKPQRKAQRHYALSEQDVAAGQSEDEAGNGHAVVWNGC